MIQESNKEYCVSYRYQTLLQRHSSSGKVDKTTWHQTSPGLYQNRKEAIDQILPLQPRQTVQTKSSNTQKAQKQIWESIA